MSTIVDIHGRQILDSRGNPTVEVDVTLADGTIGTAAVPSGASTGAHEAWELRDGDKAVFLGKGVLKAVENINTKIADELIGMDALEQIAVDGLMIELDGTPNKKESGCERDPGRVAGGRPCGGPLLRSAAVPLSGRFERPGPARPDDEHPQWRPARRQLSRLQEFMVMPLGFDTFSEALRCGCEIFHNLKKVLHDKKLNTVGGRRRRIRARFDSQRRCLRHHLAAIEKAGYKPGEQVWFALDSGQHRVLRSEEEGLHDRRQGTRFGGDGRLVGQLGRQISDLLD